MLESTAGATDLTLPVTNSTPTNTSSSGLLRQVGLFDATMIVMGGIVGAGIFINPYVAASRCTRRC